MSDPAPRAPRAGQACRFPRKGPPVLLLLSLLLVAGCSVCLHPHRNIWLVDQTYDGKTAYVKTGDWIRVVLAANPSTGYAWEVTREGGAAVADGEPQLDEAGPAPGAGGTVTIPFRAERPGITDLTFSYRRLGEKDIPPARTLHVAVFVQ